MTTPLLYLTHDPDFDRLDALEFGCVPDGHPQRCWQPVTDTFAFWRPARRRKPRGFVICRFSEFDVNDPEIEKTLWDGLRFSAPLLHLRHATAGEIITAARAYFGSEASLNRSLFQLATTLDGEEALDTWRRCLESGDSMAHFAIGYTLFELGRFREAYGDLRIYTELAPDSSWNWCWFGKAAAAIGETSEAERGFVRALKLTRRGDAETDAEDLLATLRSD